MTRQVPIGSEGSTPVQPEFRWPTHRDLTFIKPPLEDEDLHDALSPDLDRELVVQLKFKDEKFIRNTYARLYDPRLDGTLEEALYAWRHCHNGLWNARRMKFLAEVEVYYLAERLVSLAQYEGDTPLGLHKEGKWFMLPEIYTIQAGGGYTTGDLALFAESEEAEAKLRERFHKAKVTVHLVNFPNHWAVIFYQPATGATCYIDSQYTNRHRETKTEADQYRILKWRCKEARKEFDSWLERSKLPRPNPDKHLCASSPDQEDGWSCGFQVIANILAFIRYGAVGWHRIGYWADQCRRSRRRAVRNMRKELVLSLHSIMGLRLGNTTLNAVKVDGLQVMDKGRGDDEDVGNLPADGMPGEDFNDDAAANGDHEDPIDYNAGTGKRTSSRTRKSDRVTRGDKLSQSDAPRPAATADLGRTRAHEERAQKQRDMAARLAKLRELARRRTDAMVAALKAETPYIPPEEETSRERAGTDDDHDGGSARGFTESTNAGPATAEASKTKGASGRVGGKTSLKRKADDAVPEGDDAEEKKQPRGRSGKRKKTW